MTGALLLLQTYPRRSRLAVDRSERRSRSGRRARRLPEAKAGRAAERFGFQRKRAPFRSRAALASWCAPRLNYRARTEGPAPGAMRIAAATAAALLAALIAPRRADAQAETYSVEPGVHCGGTSLNPLEDGSPYPLVGAELSECIARCHAAAACNAVVVNNVDGRCYWKDTTSGQESHENAEVDCYTMLVLPPAAPLEGRVWFDEDLNRAAAVGTWGRAVDYCSAQVRSRHAQACPNAPQHALRAARGGRPMPRL